MKIPYKLHYWKIFGDGYGVVIENSKGVKRSAEAVRINKSYQHQSDSDYHFFSGQLF